MNKTRTYYQPVAYIDDGTNIEWGETPDELHSFQAFASMDDCRQWLENNGYDPACYSIREYHDDDIEDVTIIDGDGDIVEVNGTGENAGGLRKSAELNHRLDRLNSDVDRAVESLLRQHMGQEVSFYRASENGFGNIPCIVARAGFSSEFENMSVDEVCFGVNDKGRFFVSLDASGNYGNTSVVLSDLDAGDRISVLEALEDFFSIYPKGNACRENDCVEWEKVEVDGKEFFIAHVTLFKGTERETVITAAQHALDEKIQKMIEENRYPECRSADEMYGYVIDSEVNEDDDDEIVESLENIYDPN